MRNFVRAGCLLLVLLACLPALGTTWYVRRDGGSRYSTEMKSGQCDGKTDAAYPGKGTNQHCAFNDVRLLWQDGSYATQGSKVPAWGWVGEGGDTYIIRGSIAEGVSWRVGWSSNVNCNDPKTKEVRGLCGDPYGSGAPVPPSGTGTQHTRVLGGNYASCHAESARTQLHGGYAAGAVLNLAGASYVDVACLDITDFSACGKLSQSHQCMGAGGAPEDFASNGIQWSNKSNHVTVTDVRIHGMAAAGMLGPTGDGVVMDYVELLGNPSSGWNADSSDGTTGLGSLLVQHYNISWNGCAEQYPIVDKVPYADCTDQNSGGYGDGFGTATVNSNPGWKAHFDQGVVSYNTQDGLDALHLRGNGSSMTITRTLAYGNMGQQIKVGGESGTAINNLIVGNCFAMKEAIPGTPAGFNSKLSDFCRASDVPVNVTVSNGRKLTFDFNTIYSANTVGVEVECDSFNGECDQRAVIDYRNNVFVGFPDDAAHGNPNGQGQNPAPIYVGESFQHGLNPFKNPGSLYSNNVTYSGRNNWRCPAAGESAAICGDPGLVDKTWHRTGYGNMAPASGASRVVGSGVAIEGVTDDYAGKSRGAKPSRGALEPEGGAAAGGAGSARNEDGGAGQTEPSATGAEEGTQTHAVSTLTVLKWTGAAMLAVATWQVVRLLRNRSDAA